MTLRHNLPDVPPKDKDGSVKENIEEAGGAKKYLLSLQAKRLEREAVLSGLGFRGLGYVTT